MTIEAETVGSTVGEWNALYITERANFPSKSTMCMSLRCVPGKRIFLGLVGINEE